MKRRKQGEIPLVQKKQQPIDWEEHYRQLAALTYPKGVKKYCCICGRRLTKQEERGSEQFVGGNRFYCTTHLNQLMDW